MAEIVQLQAPRPKQAANQVAPLVAITKAERVQLKDFNKEPARLP